MGYKNKTISLNKKIIIAFTIIMTLTIITIGIFLNKCFKLEFTKYVDNSNKAEVKHLIFDLKNIYEDGSWDIETIKLLGEDAILKGIALEIYDKENNLVWSTFEDEKVLSNSTLNEIKRNMKSIDSKWNGNFKKYKIENYDNDKNIVGYSYIGHYESTYYMENDMDFLNIMNKFIIIIGVVSLAGIILISIIISKSISNPITKVSKMAKIIEEGNYKNKLDYKSNISEVKELIESINKLADALNEQEALRKRLTTDIAHELRTPLTSIKGHLDAIIDGIWEPTNERLISINEEVSRLSNLVDQLRNLEKVDREKNKLKIESVNLKELMQSIVYNYQSKALEKNINIKYESKDIEVFIDKEKFSQVIVNLLVNAIKFTNYKGQICIKTYLENGYINISIKDNGIGIPKDNIDYIFERFYRVDKSRNKDTGGIGVGLTIVKSIVNAHGGDIFVNSEINKGSEFIIKLPNNIK